MNDLILYTTEDGRSQIKVRTDRRTVWLSQREMAELFDVSVDNIGLHLKNIYQDGELIREATAEESSVVQIEGSREVQRPVTLYNLDAILAVGYRVRSPRGVQFRRPRRPDRAQAGKIETLKQHKRGLMHQLSPAPEE
jgi:hypothetical protein